MIGSSAALWGTQLLSLSFALLLSTAIGFERQLKSKSAGMRTHALVGTGAALFMVVSKFGFDDVLVKDLVRLDPSRVAAQIVSGIGFIGAGLVFVRRNKVRGLTTAASIWLTAGVGTAAGAGLIIPAVFVTLAHFLVVFLYPFIVSRTRLGNLNEHVIHVTYLDGIGALRVIMLTCTELGFAIMGFTTRAGEDSTLSRVLGKTPTADDGTTDAGDVTVEVELEINGTTPISVLTHRLGSVAGVRGLSIDDDAE
ncbi:MgtC/SapB family protein [Arthrobacter terrae]|uniref:MgtC/SapB family protein n=1 Tax=Arthrobacter terrae TaxID=2935737 RepID=UPI001E3ECF67|nr:MgtC/SapB family protein [Arthrobacter terrae]